MEVASLFNTWFVSGCEQKVFLPQLLLISQSDWLICRCRQESIPRCSRHCVAQFIFQLALWKKNIFFDVDIVVKNKSKCGLAWFVLLSTTSTRHYFFSNNFSYCFCMLSEFAKLFERKVWRVQVASSLAWCSACTFKSESVFSIVNKFWQRFLSLSFILW